MPSYQIHSRIPSIPIHIPSLSPSFFSFFPNPQMRRKYLFVPRFASNFPSPFAPISTSPNSSRDVIHSFLGSFPLSSLLALFHFHYGTEHGIPSPPPLLSRLQFSPSWFNLCQTKTSIQTNKQLHSYHRFSSFPKDPFRFGHNHVLPFPVHVPQLTDSRVSFKHFYASQQIGQ